MIIRCPYCGSYKLTISNHETICVCQSCHTWGWVPDWKEGRPMVVGSVVGKEINYIEDHSFAVKFAIWNEQEKNDE